MLLGMGCTVVAAISAPVLGVSVLGVSVLGVSVLGVTGSVVPSNSPERSA
ncbi:MAG: hypothetical protein M0013_14765 [Actinomycetota bacterium]|nr:hypothetical protein [Actinomycetota bacterium]